MVKKAVTTLSRDTSGFLLFLLHLSCFLLVVLYVNMFQFWAWVSRQLGPGLMVKILPVLVTLAVLSVIVYRFIQRVNSGYQIKYLFLALGVVIAFFSLAIPDPHVPIKRIHVAEYIVLSFVVRYTLSCRLSGVRLTLFTFLVTALLGIHDEMLQGLHSLRYYGWRDIIVNGMAGLSGSLLGHGLLSFENREGNKTDSHTVMRVTPGLIIVYVLLLAGVCAHVILLYQQRGGHFSIISLLPLSIACLAAAFLYPSIVTDSQRHHGLQSVFWLALGLLIYPIVANIAGIEFI